jgi:4-amino-4-deoxy-L-arabinose transferase-like glycosyltransferase
VALFLVRGAFYCRMLPLWEGWDEHAHFAVLQHWSAAGTLPKLNDSFSREIDDSLRLAPLPHELGWLGPPYLTHEQWWALPQAERDARRRGLAALSPDLAKEAALHQEVFYEAQQPPAYYWLFSFVLKMAERWPIRDRVLLIRFLGMMLASATIPLTWLAARRLLPEPWALLCAGLIAVAPGFAIEASRVTNDCLAIPLIALLFWLVMRRSADWLGIGFVLGLCLLTRAYCLTLLPSLLIWFAIRNRRDWRTPARVFGVALAISGWWYARNLALGYTLSGWLEHASVADMADAVFRVNWISAVHVVFKSFVWFGAWSFLTLKVWMYAVVELFTLAGIAMAIRRHGRELSLPLLVIGWYCVALTYGVLVDSVVHKIGNIPGWYLWSIASLMSVVLVAGLGRWTVALVAVLAGFDIYGAAGLMAPYYAGLVERNRANGAVFFGALERMGVPAAWGVVWLGATVAIPILCLAWRKGAADR